MWFVVASIWLSAAHAVRVPVDYRSEVAAEWAGRLEALNLGGRYTEVLEQGKDFVRAVEPLALVEYEMGFAANRLGRLELALEHYGRAIELDPKLAAALYDRGELLLRQGERDAAQADFEQAAAVRPDHWVVHFRLAHIDALSGKGPAFEAHVIEAMRHGFDFRYVLDDPDWRAWSVDPVLGPIIARLIRAYSDERLLFELRGQDP